ncbi:MAG: hypothetical protein M1822_002435 [Bathelium mastoideum]|nr:MAG: hypothetical protein M1822_002435 [Bathelium mastoideum]
MEVLQETKDGLNVHMAFNRHVSGLAGRLLGTLRPWFEKVRNLFINGSYDSDESQERAIHNESLFGVDRVHPKA